MRTNISDGVYGLPDVSFHGTMPWCSQFAEYDRYAAVMFAGQESSTGPQVIYVASNAYWEDLDVVLPELPASMCWDVAVDTWNEEQKIYPLSEGHIRIHARSVMILVGK